MTYEGCCRAAVDSDGHAHDHADWLRERDEARACLADLEGKVDRIRSARDRALFHVKLADEERAAATAASEAWEAGRDSWRDKHAAVAKQAEAAEARLAEVEGERDEARKVIAAHPSWSGYLSVVEDAAQRRWTDALAAENARLLALTATCSCPLGSYLEGPTAECPVHGAVRALNEAIVERDEAVSKREAMADRLEESRGDCLARMARLAERLDAAEDELAEANSVADQAQRLAAQRADEVARMRSVVEAAEACVDDAQAPAHAVYADWITVNVEPGVREGWYRATCNHCDGWYSTGAEPIVEEAAYDHIADAHADLIAAAEVAVGLVRFKLRAAVDAWREARPGDTLGAADIDQGETPKPIEAGSLSSSTLDHIAHVTGGGIRNRDLVVEFDDNAPVAAQEAPQGDEQGLAALRASYLRVKAQEPTVADQVGFLVTGEHCGRCGDTNFDKETRVCLTCTYPDDIHSRAHTDSDGAWASRLADATAAFEAGEKGVTERPDVVGLDEAIEAASIEMWQAAGRSTPGTAWADIHPARQGWYRDMARAAAPILVRAALLEAADAIEAVCNHPPELDHANTSGCEYHQAASLVRDRAARLVSS